VDNTPPRHPAGRAGDWFDLDLEIGHHGAGVRGKKDDQHADAPEQPLSCGGVECWHESRSLLMVRLSTQAKNVEVQPANVACLARWALLPKHLPVGR
jgi:hypothetical protein